MHMKWVRGPYQREIFVLPARPQQLPMDLVVRTGGRHVNANRVNKGIGMGNTGSTGMGRESIGFGINKTGGMKGPLVVVWKTWVTLYLG